MGPYWAIGCLAELYRAVAIVGVIAGIVLVPLTHGLSLLLIPAVFTYIVVAQFFRLLIDLASSSRGTYEILKARSVQKQPPPDPHGPWRDATLRDDLRQLRQRYQPPAAHGEDDEFAPPPRTRR